MADPFNSATPADGDYAIFGAAELRAIKGRINALVNPGNTGNSMASFRNRAINPCFLFDGLNEGTNYAANGFDVDGWSAAMSLPGVITRVRNTDVDGVMQRACTVTTVDAAPAAGATYASYTQLEGYATADFRQGFAGATGFTVMFTARASIAGNYPIAFRNAALSRSYVTTFNIAIASVDQIVVINVPGDTAGVWVGEGTGVGLDIWLDLGSGANLVAPVLNAWQAGNYVTAAGVVKPIGTLNSVVAMKNFMVCPYQIAAPVFERPSYLQQWAYTQRYQPTYNGIVTNADEDIAPGFSTTNAAGLVVFKFPTLVRPSITGVIFTAIGAFSVAGPAFGGPITSLTVGASGPSSARLAFTTAAAAIVASQPCSLRINAAARLTFTGARLA